MPINRIALTLLLTLPLLTSACSRRLPPPSPELGAPAGAILLWPKPKDTVRLLAAAGLEPVQQDHNLAIYHIHAHLEVFKDGQQIAIPQNIGIGDDVVSPLHTHRESGVIHVESPKAVTTRLGQFFTLWDVPMEGANVVINGVEVSDPASHVLADRDLITVYFGTEPPGQ